MTKFSSIIFFQGGCYGTLLEWACVTAASKSFDNPLPFTDLGSSHLYQSNFIDGPEILEYVKTPNHHEFCNMHPGIFRDGESGSYVFDKSFSNILAEDLNFLRKHFKKILVLHPDSESALQVENNDLSKSFLSEENYKKYYESSGVTRDELKVFMTADVPLRMRHMIDQLVNHPCSQFSVSNIQQWGKSSVYDLDTWEFRELLSLFWFTQIDPITKAWEESRAINTHSDTMYVSVTELNRNFTQTILKCLNHFGIPSSERLEDFVKTIYAAWAPRQQHINKDALVTKIVDCITQQIDFDWSNEALTILDEACIQRLLRDRNIELKCGGLNKFPTNTRDISPFLDLQ